MAPISSSTPVQASGLSIDELARNPNISESAKVAEVSRQFEALLLRQIMQSAHVGASGAATAKNSTVNGIYEDLVTSHLADTMTRGQAGGLGLARTLERQLGSELASEVKPPFAISQKDRAANLRNHD